MADNTNITNITPPRVALIDARTGAVTREWYRFFYNLFYAVGGLNQGAIPPSRGGTGTSQIPTDGDLLIGNGETGAYNATQLTLGSGLSKTVGHGTLLLENTGVWSITAGDGISIDQPTGNVTITNDGVLSFSAGTTGFTPISATTGDIVLDGVLNITNGGTGATNSTDARTNLQAAKSGANSDITSLLGITGPIQTPTYIDFNTASADPARQTGRLFWDDADGNQTLSLYMAGANATMQIGEETYYRIKASSAITEGQVVMFTGTVGASGALTGAPATGLTAETASYVMGVATENIANNNWGYITAFGLVRGFNTTGGAETWADGQILYLNPSVAGGLTKTVPSAPNAKVQVCAVIHAASNGSVFVRPTYGGKLGQFEGDVGITSVATSDLLQYNGSYWTNVTPASVISGAGGAPVTKTADFTVAAGETWLINNKSGSTCTVTLPAAASNPGRTLTFQNYQNQQLVSASSNVIPLAGGSAGTAILENIAGNWATMVSNGTNWVIMQSAPNNILLI